MADKDKPSLKDALAAFEEKYVAEHAKLNDEFDEASKVVIAARKTLADAQAKAQQVLGRRIAHSIAGDAERLRIETEFAPPAAKAA